MMNEYIYIEILGPVIQALYSEVMIIGMFLVGFSYLRSAMWDAKGRKSEHFWRQGILLVSVMLFSIYIVLSYNVISTDEVFLEEVSLEKDLVLSPTTFFLLIAPLELAMVALSGAMFLVLSRSMLSSHPEAGTETHIQTPTNSQQTLIFLFGATGLWHLMCMLWWLFWLGSDDRFSSDSVYFHARIALVHMSSMFIWRYVTSKAVYSLRENFFDWIGVAWYFSIISAVYFLRMSWFVAYLADAVKDNT